MYTHIYIFIFMYIFIYLYMYVYTYIHTCIQVGEYHAGSFFGQLSLLDDEKRKYTIRANTKTEVFTIDRDTFENIIGTDNHDSLKGIHVCIYIYVYKHTYIYIYIYIHTFI
jgi:hypothetical protein